MAVTILLGDDRQHVWAVVSPLAELTSALHVLTAPDHHLGLTDWRRRISSTFTPRMAAELSAFQFLWDTYRATFLLPGGAVERARPGNRTGAADRTGAAERTGAGDRTAAAERTGAGERHLPETPSLAAELQALADMSVDDFASQALHPLVSRPDLPIQDAPLDTTERLLTHARARNRAVEATTSALLDGPDQVRVRLLEFLAACDDAFFAFEWAGMAPSLERAAADVRAQRAQRGAAAALVGLAHGIHAAGTTVTIDKSTSATIDLTGDRDLVVIPSLLCHPHVLVQSDPSWPYTIQYPAQRRLPGRQLPPLSVTTRRLEALADSSRLELCALIAREARATQELAAMTGLSTPTVSRHLKVLRDAGLVTSSQHGHFRLHELDLDAVEGLGQALVASLLR